MDRVVAARERLETNRAFALQALGAGPPCSDCRFKTLLGNCGNPAYAEPHFDAPKGVYEESYLTSVRIARAADGLCGPEALLFESLTVPLIAAKTAWGGLKLAWFGAIAVVFLIFLSGR